MKKSLKTISLWGILFMFAMGAIFHAIYDFTGKPLILGLFFPVNESIFEHIKIATLPVFLWYLVWYFIKKEEINANKWFTSALISMLVSGILVPMLYYFYTETFGVELMIVDILILLVALFVGQIIAIHYYEHGRGIDYKLALAIMILIIILMALATVFPPRLPIFKETLSGTYGIFMSI